MLVAFMFATQNLPEQGSGTRRRHISLDARINQPARERWLEDE
ncbi:hypothetical protein [Caballeronia arvi]|nr:hypothetical protein [Caballeronia arvi]